MSFLIPFLVTAVFLLSIALYLWFTIAAMNWVNTKFGPEAALVTYGTLLISFAAGLFNFMGQATQ